MDNHLLIAGILLNAALIVINRFVYQLPNWIQIPLLLAGIGLILAGMVRMRK
jgi:hypothetical protein